MKFRIGSNCISIVSKQESQIKSVFKQQFLDMKHGQEWPRVKEYIKEKNNRLGGVFPGVVYFLGSPWKSQWWSYLGCFPLLFWIAEKRRAPNFWGLVLGGDAWIAILSPKINWGGGCKKKSRKLLKKLKVWKFERKRWKFGSPLWAHAIRTLTAALCLIYVSVSV